MLAKEFDDVTPGEMDDYVPALFARSLDEAEQYCQLLEDHDIPAVADEEFEPPRKGKGKGNVAVLVPESLLEDARAFISEMEEMDALPDGDELEDDEDEEDDDLQPSDEYDEADDLEVDTEDEEEAKAETEDAEKDEEAEEEDEEGKGRRRKR